MINIRRLVKSFIYSFRGLQKVFREEQNLKIQSIAAVAVLILAYLLKLELMEWIVLILSMSLVFLAEVVNSAVERVTDVLKPRINDYVKEIKDIMAAAVMISALTSIVIGIIIFYPHIMEFLQ